MTCHFWVVEHVPNSQSQFIYLIWKNSTSNSPNLKIMSFWMDSLSKPTPLERWLRYHPWHRHIMWHLTIGSGSHFARWIRESRCRTFARLGGEKRPGTSSPQRLGISTQKQIRSQWPKIMTAHLNTSYLWPQIQTSDSSSSSCAIFKSAITLASCRFSCSRWGSHAFH